MAKTKTTKTKTSNFHLEFQLLDGGWAASYTYPNTYTTEALAKTMATKANNKSKRDGWRLIYKVAKGKNRG